jgi:hypothetical protein
MQLKFTENLRMNYVSKQTQNFKKITLLNNWFIVSLTFYKKS